MYDGKESDLGRKKAVVRLSECKFETNRNVIYDNWFTSSKD